MLEKIAIHWFRRDLRLVDNAALSAASKSGLKVLPVFIFDTNILSELDSNDSRVSFIHKTLMNISAELKTINSSLLVYIGEPLAIWKQILQSWPVGQVYYNKDYEPYATKRDGEITQTLQKNGVGVFSFKDQVIIEENEVLKADGKPYTIFTPYKNKWLEKFKSSDFLIDYSVDFERFVKFNSPFPSLIELGFLRSSIEVLPYNLSQIDQYSEMRNLPAEDATSYLSPHLRFGTVSVRHIIRQLGAKNQSFLDELIWREFFQQILFHFPQVVNNNFKSQYDGIKWRNNESDFQRWCEGKTGYPMVDAGMRQLNQSGYMHNRVRMVVASFLTKHLLIDWRWGEAYFSKHLLDYELAANNGNWQWAAGTGCDAAPYFRVFNPSEQLKKFDPKMIYVNKWVPELNDFSYPEPMVDHKMARERALEVYKLGLIKNGN